MFKFNQIYVGNYATEHYFETLAVEILIMHAPDMWNFKEVKLSESVDAY